MRILLYLFVFLLIYILFLITNCIKCRKFMGVIETSSSSSLCLLKSNFSSHHFVVPNRTVCPFQVNQRRVIAMSSTLPVEQQVNEGQRRLTGDSFIRSHLRKLKPYQPILPFEVCGHGPFELSQRSCLVQ